MIFTFLLLFFPLPTSAPSLFPFIHQSAVAAVQSSAGAVNKRALQLLQTVLQPQTPFLPETVGSRPICSSHLSQLSPSPTQLHYIRPPLLVATAVKAGTDTAGEGSQLLKHVLHAPAPLLIYIKPTEADVYCLSSLCCMKSMCHRTLHNLGPPLQ